MAIFVIILVLIFATILAAIIAAIFAAIFATIFSSFYFPYRLQKKMQNTSPPLYWDPAEFGTLQQKPKKPRKIETRTLSGRLHPRGCHCLNEWPLKTDSSGNYVTNCDGYQIHLQPTVNGHTEWPCAPYPNHTYDECPLQILGKHPEAKERVKQQVLEKHNRLLQEWTAQGRKKRCRYCKTFDASL